MITTITLNPALDKLLRVGDFIWGDTNRTECLAQSAAGKGVDVAKILRDLDYEVCATGFLGGVNLPLFEKFFESERITDEFVKIKGSTRTNIQLFSADGKRTELLEKGPEISAEESEALLKKVDELKQNSSVIAICGSAPSGISNEYFSRLIRTSKDSNAIVVTDTSGELLKVAIKEKSALIKPNKLEMLELMGKKKAELSEIIEFAQQIVKASVPYVLISMGGEGALLVCEKGVWRGKAPDVEVKSTLGCGDTMVASCCISFLDKHSPEAMLKNAIALSSANAMTFETAHVTKNDFESLLKVVNVEKI